MKINKKDLIALKRSNDNMENNPSELNEVLNQYMKAYVDNNNSVMLYLDEIENLININDHKRIVDYILNK